MIEPEFLTLAEVLEIHAQQIERYGGSNGLRDPAGLESAVATPQTTFDANTCIAPSPRWRQHIFELRCKLVES